MRFIAALAVILTASQTFSFDQPRFLVCRSELSIQVSPKKTLGPGEYKIEIKTNRILTVLGPNSERLFKLYPEEGLDWVLFDKKNIKINSDSRTYLEAIYSKKGISRKTVFCRTEL